MSDLAIAIRKLAEEHAGAPLFGLLSLKYQRADIIESAIHAGIKLVLEWEPSGKQNEKNAANLALQLWMLGPSLKEGKMPDEQQIREMAETMRRAMTAELLKDLEEK